MWSSTNSWAQQLADAAKAASDAASKISMDDFAKNLENIANLDKLMKDADDDNVVIGVDGESIILDSTTTTKKIDDNNNDKQKLKADNNNNNNNTTNDNDNKQQELLIYQLQDLLRSSDNELSIIKENYKKLEDESIETNEKVNNLQSDLDSKENELISINITMQLLKSSLEQNENEKNTLIATVDQLQSSLEQSEIEKKAALNIAEDFEKQKKNNEKMIEQVEALKKTIKARDSEISKLQKGKNSKKNDNNSSGGGASGDSSESNKMLRELEDAIQKLNEEKLSLEEKVDELSTASQQSEENRRKDRQEMQTEIDNMKTRLKKQKEDYQKETEKTKKLNEKLLADLQNEAQTLKAQHEKQLKDLNSNLDNLKKKNKDDVKSVQTEIKTKESVIERLSHELDEKRAKLEGLEKECADKMAELVVKAKAVDDMTQACQEATNTLISERASSSSSITSYETSLNELNETLKSKDAKIDDLDGKVKTLSEKMKEVMKKYAEEKAKNKEWEQKEMDKDRDTGKAIQRSESEVLTMKLKLETMENSLSDEKEAREGLAEKNGELQRELARAKETVSEKDLTIESLKAEASSLEEVVNHLKSENGSLQEASDILRSEVRGLQEVRDSDRSSLQQQIKTMEASMEERLRELKEENESLSSRLKAENAAAASLDEYKKRAQTAVKKANAEKAAATSELEKMSGLVEEASSKLAIAESQADVLRRELSTAREENDELMRRCSDADSLSQVTEEKKKLEEAHNESLLELEYTKKEIQYLNSELESLRNGKGGSATPRRKAHNSSFTNTNDSEADSMISDDFAVLALTPLSEARQGAKSRNQSTVNERDDLLVRSLTYESKRNDVTISEQSSSAVSPITPAASSVLNVQDTPGEYIEIDNGISLKLKPSTSGDLYYVNQLNSQIDELRHSLSLKGLEVESNLNELQLAKEEKKRLEVRIEELLAYLDRTKKLQEGDSAVNMEYLKNCIYRFMSTNEVSEKKRLFPVIATILKLTSSEKKQIEVALAVEENSIPEVNTIKNIAESWGFSFS